jgi:uncharacterized protein
MVERAFIVSPASQIGPITAAERSEIIANSIVAGVYEKAVDRESAYEKIKGRVQASMPSTQEVAPAGSSPAPQQAPQSAPQAPARGPSIGDMFGNAMGGLFGGSGVARRKDTMVEAMVKSAARSIGSQVGREIIRGVLGSILKK